MLRSALVYGTLLLLAGASVWLLINLRSSLQTGATRVPQGPPVYLDNFVATRMNAQGVRLYSLSGPNLKELAHDQGTEVTDPRIKTFRNADQLDWTITARRGWLSPDHSLLILKQDVVGQRAPSERRPALTLTSEQLLYRSDQHLVTSPVEVELSSAAGWLKGRGLLAHLDSREIRLLHDVQGRYAPASH